MTAEAELLRRILAKEIKKPDCLVQPLATRTSKLRERLSEFPETLARVDSILQFIGNPEFVRLEWARCTPEGHVCFMAFGRRFDISCCHGGTNDYHVCFHYGAGEYRFEWMTVAEVMALHVASDFMASWLYALETEASEKHCKCCKCRSSETG